MILRASVTVNAFYLIEISETSGLLKRGDMKILVVG